MANDKLKCLKHEMDPYLSNKQRFTPDLRKRIRNSVKELELENKARTPRFIFPKLMTAALSLVLIFSIGWVVYENASFGTISGNEGKDDPIVIKDAEENNDKDDSPPIIKEENDEEAFYLQGSYLGDDVSGVIATYGEPAERFYDDKTGIETLKYSIQEDPFVWIHFSVLDSKIVGLSMYYDGPIREEGVYNKNRYISDFGEPSEVREVSCYHTATCEELVYRTKTAEKIVRFSWEGNLEFVTIKNTEVYRAALSEEEILSIILKGREHFWYAFLGGNDTNHTTFNYNDWEVEFDYFGEDLDTAEKMIDYLDDVYSQRMIDYLFMKYDWIEHDGKLARPQMGLGSLTNWKELKFIDIERTATKISVMVEVPLGDTGQVIEEEVTLIYSEEKSWVLDTEIR